MVQETYSPCTKLLPIALLRLRNTLGKQGSSPFASLYSRPFLSNDLLLDEETAQLASHVTQLAEFQQVLSEVNQGIYLGDLILVKSSDPAWSLNVLPCEDPFPVILLQQCG
jgi:hypothetical protein